MLVGIFDSDEKILRAALKAREMGIPAAEAYTPFPIHGIDEALEIRPSLLPRVCLVGGVAGLSIAFLLQYWTHAVNWPMNIGGKSFAAFPAMVPVCFELTVLLAGVGTFFAFLYFSGMHPFKTSPIWGLQTENDRFALSFECGSEAVAQKVSDILKDEGVLEVREL